MGFCIHCYSAFTIISFKQGQFFKTSTWMVVLSGLQSSASHLHFQCVLTRGCALHAFISFKTRTGWRRERSREWFPAILRPLRNLAVCMALPSAPSVPLVVEAFSDLRKNLRSCLPVGTDVHSGPPPGLPKAWYLAGAGDHGRWKSPARPLSLHLAGMC